MSEAFSSPLQVLLELPRQVLQIVIPAYSPEAMPAGSSFSVEILTGKNGSELQVVAGPYAFRVDDDQGFPGLDFKLGIAADPGDFIGATQRILSGPVETLVPVELTLLPKV